MIARRPLSLGWRLALAFTLLSGLYALTLGLYIVNARQHVGANYAALVGDVVRAQQHPMLLRMLLDDARTAAVPDSDRFENLLWRIPRHIAGVVHGLEQSQLNPSDYAAPVDALRRLEPQLPELQALVERAVSDASAKSLLETQGNAIESELAWAYGELNELLHSAAAAQRRLMERLSWAIGSLILLSLLVVGGLMAALAYLSQQRATVARLSLVDELTGLGNRRYLRDSATRLYEQSLRSDEPLSLLLIDLDHFKRLNDTWGHPAGDRVLVAFAQALRQTTRQADSLARIGGEEFCVLMPNTPLAGAYDFAERIRQRMAALDASELGIPVTLTVSLGLASGAGPEAGFDSLYSRADRALYRAKAQGRNRTECSELHDAIA